MDVKVDVLEFGWVAAKACVGQEQAYCWLESGIAVLVEDSKLWVGYEREPAFGDKLETDE